MTVWTKEHRREQAARRRAKSQSVAKTDADAIVELVEQQNQRIDAVPAFSEFLGQLIVAFGGPEALAREYHATYSQAKEGSQARVQLILKMSDLMLRNTQHFGAPAKIEELSDDELIATMARFYEAVGTPGGTETLTEDGEDEDNAETIPA